MIKVDWITHLHACRKRELEIAFANIGRKFNRGLELGAGDGYQSQLLLERVVKLTATDLNSNRLPSKMNTSNIQYVVCDAERIGSTFENKSFDLIYSSNLLEHLPDVQSCLTGIHHLLEDDGVTINIMPSPGWRLFATVLHLPNKVVNIIDRWIFNNAVNNSNGNNLKVKNIKRSAFYNLLIPKAHGVSSNFIIEFWHFRKNRWKKEFECAGFELVDIIKGPVSSGYGFGFDKARQTFEKLGIATEYIYIARKLKD